MNLSKRLKINSPLCGKVLFNEPLSQHTSIKAGGPARVWIEPETVEQLCELVKLSKNGRISIFTIGAGCNIIVGADGIDGICVRLSAPCFKKIEFKGALVKVGAGVSLSQLLDLASERSLGGYEFLAGIPGTVGGAIFGNAGSRGESISFLLKEIEVVTPAGKVKRIKAQNIKFSYRSSGLEGNIIISALFRFKRGRGDKKKIKSSLRINLIKKVNKQDYTAPSAGCIFKNPVNSSFSAAKLIEKCGLKGKVSGGAQISRRHANFIINKGTASPQDIFSLIQLIKKRVKSRYGIELKEEVKIIK